MGYKLGFTLVELFTVILILAVILVIAVPQIMDVIDSAKTDNLESSVKLIAKSSNDSSTKAYVNRLLNEWYLGEEDSDDPVVCYNARAGAQADSYKCTNALGNWMHNSTNYWTILPLFGGTSHVLFVYSGGLATSGSGTCNACGVRPVVYLKSGTRIIGNTGSSGTPYILV